MNKVPLFFLLSDLLFNCIAQTFTKVEQKLRKKERKNVVVESTFVARATTKLYGLYAGAHAFVYERNPNNIAVSDNHKLNS